MSADPLAALSDLDGVGDAVLRSRQTMDRLLNHRVLRRRSPEVSAESALRGVWASAVMSGVETSLDAIRAGEVDDPTVQGALRVSAELGALADTWTQAPRQALARLHVLAGADVVDDRQRLGRPADDVVARRLDLLSSTLGATRAPAVVVAAVVWGELTILDAFAPITTIVANAAARLTLVERGLDPKSLVPIEVGAVELIESRTEALAGFAAGSPDGVAAWIRFTAECFELGARDTTAICEALQRG